MDVVIWRLECSLFLVIKVCRLSHNLDKDTVYINKEAILQSTNVRKSPKYSSSIIHVLSILTSLCNNTRRPHIISLST